MPYVYIIINGINDIAALIALSLNLLLNYYHKLFTIIKLLS